MTWYDDGGDRRPGRDPTRVVTCAYCGQPFQPPVAIAEPKGIKTYHGDCYRKRFPPQHPDRWPRIETYSFEERVVDGTQYP